MKTLITLALLASAHTLPAQAVPVNCSMEEYGPQCAFNYGAGGNDLILVQGPDGSEKIRVVCNQSPHDWTSNGPNTQEFVQNVVTRWCGS